MKANKLLILAKGLVVKLNESDDESLNSAKKFRLKIGELKDKLDGFEKMKNLIE
ncbi:hypothetical protein HYW82_00325 [Candidatus Peregrinibacteria bacterium]|nr:hypothetical protein [Candidatus Peregrinibacteria bacterium]